MTCVDMRLMQMCLDVNRFSDRHYYSTGFWHHLQKYDEVFKEMKMRGFELELKKTLNSVQLASREVARIMDLMQQLQKEQHDRWFVQHKEKTRETFAYIRFTDPAKNLKKTLYVKTELEPREQIRAFHDRLNVLLDDSEQAHRHMMQEVLEGIRSTARYWCLPTTGHFMLMDDIRLKEQVRLASWQCEFRIVQNLRNLGVDVLLSVMGIH